MKATLRTLALAIISVFTFNAAFAGNDRPISVDQLPQAAQQTLGTHFAGIKVAMAKFESELLDKSYDVILTDGTKLEFDANGNWNEISCKTTTVPAALVPAKITDYINANHKGAKVKKIEKDRNRYEVELTNKVELTFNKKFKVVDIDF